MTEPHQQPVHTEIEIVRQALEKGKHKRIRKLLRGMHPAKVASLLESLESGQRSALWQQVDDDAEQKVLAHVSEKLRAFFRQDRERAEEAPAPEMDTHTELDRLRDALELGKLKRVRRMLRRVHPAKAAGLLESVPPGERSTAWNMVESEEAGRILVHLHEGVRTRLALVIRGLALGHLQRGNAPVLLWKEFGIGALNGLIWALVVAALAILWFESWQIGGIIAAAILLNMLCAALAGVAIPLVLRELDIDPALAGGVILTTVTDVVGFFAFLGLATLILL